MPPTTAERVAKIQAKAAVDAANILAAMQETVNRASIAAAESSAAAQAAHDAQQSRRSARVTVIVALIAFASGVATPLVTGLVTKPDTPQPDCTTILTQANALFTELPYLTEIVPPDSDEEERCSVNSKIVRAIRPSPSISSGPTT